MTARFAADPVEVASLSGCEVPLWPACWDRFSGEAARPDAGALQLAKASLCLPSFAFHTPDLAFDSLGEKGRRPPVRATLPHLLESVACAGLGNGKSRALPGRESLPATIYQRAGGRAVTPACPLRIIDKVGRDPAVTSVRPLAAMGVAGWDAGLVGAILQRERAL
jgi:hypothetical protein